MTAGEVVANVAIGALFFAVGVLVSPAFGYISRPAQSTAVQLGEVRENADQSTTWLREWLSGRFAGASSPRPSEMSDGDKLLFAAVVTAAAVWLYLTYRAPVLVGLICFSLSLAVMSTIALVRLSRAGVIADGRGVRWALLSAYLAATVGLVNVTLLWNPPAGGEVFRSFIEGFTSRQTFASMDGFLFVTYQLVGAFAFLLVGLFSTAFSVALLSALNVHRGVWGMPIHRFAYALTAFAWSNVLGWIAVGLAGLSMVFAGGWAYEVISQAASLPDFTTETRE